MVRMRLHSFLFWSATGIAVWSALLALAGYALGQSFESVEDVVGPLSSAVVAFIVLFCLYRQATWSRRQSEREAAA
jgi:membrane protein DedA with SNARE-associated domain